MIKLIIGIVIGVVVTRLYTWYQIGQVFRR